MENQKPVPQIDAKTLKNLREEKTGSFMLVDVREADELDICKLDGIVHIPMDEIEDRIKELPKDKPLYILCRSGGRSNAVSKFLIEEGYNATNVAGGMLGWIRDIDPSLTAY